MELYGWEMVYGASTDIINKQLAQSTQSLITDFSYQVTDLDTGMEINFEGQFGTWQITGGQNSLINVAIPIQKGTLTVTTSIASIFTGTPYTSGQPIDMAGVVATIQTSLSLKPSTRLADTHELVFDFSSEQDTKAALNSISVIDMADPSNKLPSDNLKGFVKLAYRSVLAAHRDKMAYVFATVMMAGSSAQFGRPKFSTFYCSKPENSDKTYFHLLAMLNRDNADGISPKLDPMLFSNPNSNMYMGFSKDVLLQGQVQPILPFIFDKAKNPNSAPIIPSSLPGGPGPAVTMNNPTLPSAFSYDLNNHTLSGSFIHMTEFQDIYEDDGTAADISIEVQDNALHTHIATVSYVDQTIAVHYQADYHNVMVYDPSARQFTLQPDPNPVTSHSSEILSDNYWNILVDYGVIGLFLPGIMSTALSSLSNQLTIDGIVHFVINWNGIGQDFQVVDAALSNNIYMTGKTV